jgi:HPt (histidine-containing phosphotransfer) domain-containing protein
MQKSEYHLKIRRHLRSAYLLSDEKIDAVLPQFMKTLQSVMERLERVLETDRNDSLAKAGHALKGALLNLGLRELADQAFNIEKYDPQQDKEADIARLIAAIREEIRKIVV